MPLTDKRISQAQPAPRRYKLFDGRGLYLLVAPSGGKWWRWRYRFAGRERHLSLGVYPRVTLKQARMQRDAAAQQLAAGTDPGARPEGEAVVTFAAVAAEWLEGQRPTLAAATWALAERRLAVWVLPTLGARPVAEIAPPELLRLLRRIEARGRHHTAHRVRQRLGQIFRYAIVTGRLDRDPTADLRGALTAAPVRHRAAVTTPEAASDLLAALSRYGGEPATVAALHLLALTFVRPGELRWATWEEFDLEQGVWRIPGVRMKMRRDHLVPLSRQAVAWLRWLEAMSSGRGYVFATTHHDRPLGANTLNQALRNLGYGERMTAHGFRALASTLLHEQGWPPEVIELQLAHAQRNAVAAAYNRSARLTERNAMMQAWGDYLTSLQVGRSRPLPLQEMPYDRDAV
ncbi:integrase [Halorhodospira abdelmalekii]|uniref:tyrosine-type recombinase/integrase n=1 Tax=Halorhodospira abdelmalekii TaxID=421629 RepID=UPI0019066EDD|nr:integrase arm-type DNA-binding domain-containing protein [Halorhodospira abdelmalekii]MBK1735768.1 integrase [Halorhodospira abdelmalekii]